MYRFAQPLQSAFFLDGLSRFGIGFTHKMAEIQHNGIFEGRVQGMLFHFPIIFIAMSYVLQPNHSSVLGKG